MPLPQSLPLLRLVYVTMASLLLVPARLVAAGLAAPGDAQLG